MTAPLILVVDDDVDIRDSLREVFEDEGYSVETAANGREGLERLHAGGAPCLVILDLMMPEMDGVEMYKRARAEPAFAALPFLISTSDPSRAPPGALIMRKPINLDLLLSTVASLCPRSDKQ